MFHIHGGDSAAIAPALAGAIMSIILGRLRGIILKGVAIFL